VLVALLLPASVANGDAAVTFPDLNLEAVIRQDMNKLPGDIYQGVFNAAGGSVNEVSAATTCPTVVSTIKIGDGGNEPYAVAVNPGTNRIYVTSGNIHDDTVLVIDGATNAIVTMVNVGMWPEGVAVNPGTNRIYVANQSSDTISVIQDDREPIELVALEVNQAVQDWNNSVQLIDNKTTYVRAYIQTKGQDQVVTSAHLHGYHDGTELPGSPLTALNPGGVVMAKPDITARRGNWSDSLNFRLPQSWLAGTVDLTLESTDGCMECKETAGTPNDCAVRVTFNSTNEPEVKFVRVRWTDSKGIVHEPTHADITELAKRLIAVYPIDRLDWTTGQLNWGRSTPDLNIVNLQLHSMALLDCMSGLSCNRLYYGNIVGSGQSGQASPLGKVASGDQGVEPNAHAHELGHVLNQNHAADTSLGICYMYGIPIPLYKLGPCNACALSSAPDFPYISEVNGILRATLGPMNEGNNSLIYGLDTNRMAVLSPFENFELMSYCFPLWISDYTYNSLRTEINNRFSSASSSQAMQALGQMQSYTVFSGTIDLGNNSVEFMPSTTISSEMAPPMPLPGNYTLELLDTTSNVVTSVPFQPIEQVALGGPDPGIGTFLIPVLEDTAVVGARVSLDGNVIGSISASLNPPEVDVIYPNGGENITGTEVTLQWTGSDPDNDKLSYLVQYSRDGNATWETLAVDWPEQSLKIERSSLGETDNGLIRVIASDGFYATSDESDGVFSVPNNAPEPYILSPVQGDVFTGDQRIFFDGVATDLEDGNLVGGSLVWTSDRDGLLGTGAALDLEAIALSEGCHVITLTATDSGGLSNTEYVRICVFTSAPPTVNLSLTAGWNMVSVPVTPGNSSVSVVFPDAAAIYTWDPISKSYIVPTTVEPSKSYWVAITQDGNITITGAPVITWLGNITAGWNMIGSIIDTASIANPNDNPDSSVQPFAYWWDPAAKSYVMTTTIGSGRGYWVASVRDCTLTMP
jgi:YVTN family beta-propeller protein